MEVYDKENVEILENYLKERYVEIFGKKYYCRRRINSILQQRQQELSTVTGSSIALMLMAVFLLINKTFLVGIIMLLITPMLFVGERWYKKRYINVDYYNSKFNETFVIDEEILKLLDNLCLEQGKTIHGKTLSLNHLESLINAFQERYQSIKNVRNTLSKIL